MFGGFWTTLLLTGLVLAALASPLFYQTRRLGRIETTKRFVIGGAVVAFISASLAAASNQNVDQCLDAGHKDCIDGGTAGMQILFMFGYLVTAWWVAKVFADQ